ncbi:hypothetical protein MNBD_ALPHA12-2206 [hydrothermal vent metagenome]|uniref:YHS domain-containing protein n=1 Tax=hydrothermal vent metagenome TaxID=652676 RepID=A0A3B0TRT0_9ZZZZ
MMEQTGKQILIMKRIFRLLAGAGKKLALAGLVLAGLVAGGAALAATSNIVPDIVVDPLSGVAMSGYDPVSYFTEKAPLKGKPEFELFWNGVPWYFASEANMEVFYKNPQIYAPQFGGFGTMSLARGFLSEGNPLIYAVLNDRLFLFYSFSNRDAFNLTDKSTRIKAYDNWPQLHDKN